MNYQFLTSREWDKEAGIYFYRARYYDANLGRFITNDPIGFWGGDVNFYSYVFNNPVNWVDSNGLNASCKLNRLKKPLDKLFLDLLENYIMQAINLNNIFSEEHTNISDEKKERKDKKDKHTKKRPGAPQKGDKGRVRGKRPKGHEGKWPPR